VAVAVAGVGEPKAKKVVTTSAIDARNAVVGVLRNIWASLLDDGSMFVDTGDRRIVVLRYFRAANWVSSRSAAGSLANSKDPAMWRGLS
jgi:hypothetical protein